MKAWVAVGGVVGVSLALMATGCGSGSGSSGGGGTTITVTFTGGTPLAVASQIGAGSFTSTTPGSRITLIVPSGTAKYAIAFVCPPLAGSTIFNSEVVIEATTQDNTTLTENCLAPPSTGTATGSASSAIAGTTSLVVIGGQNSTTLLGASGSFSMPMPVGSDDVAVVALDGSQNVLGVKIVRSQTVPGAVGGSGIVLVPPGDATTTQFVTITNVPAGFGAPSALVLYHTANGTGFGLANQSAPNNPTPYAVVPAASTQSGDLYQYFTSIASPSNQLIGTAMTTTSGGGAVTLALPTPWSFAGPAPAKLPTFTYNYSGFAGMAIAEYEALINWPVGSTTTNQISVMASANFQNGATTITIPDLASIPGFMTPAPTGTAVFWIADIFGGTPQTVLTLTNPPANASGVFVQNAGQFTQP